MTRALNRPFERPVSHPFRFAAIDAGPQAHYVVLAYDHWIADAMPPAWSCEASWASICGWRFPKTRSAWNSTRGRTGRFSGERLHGGELALAAFRAIGQWNRNRSAWRVACWSNTQWAVDYRLYHTIPGTVARLREFARANGATVHDVLLAAFGRALAEVMPSRGRRNGLALGSIVDTRSIADEDLSHAMGAFLGYYLVRSDPGATTAWMRRPVKSRPARAPSRRGTTTWTAWSTCSSSTRVWPWLSATARRHFMRKSLPMSGGISNVVVRDAWMNENRDVILDYHRGVSTGPNVPIVLSPTTFRDHLNIGVSYRMAGFSRAKIDALMEMFRDQIEHPNKASRGDLRQLPAAVPTAEPIAPRLREALTPVQP